MIPIKRKVKYRVMCMLQMQNYSSILLTIQNYPQIPGKDTDQTNYTRCIF